MYDRDLRTVLAVIAAASLLSPVMASAEEAKREFAGNFTFENDLFFNTDRYYTDGAQLEVKRRHSGAGQDPGSLLGWACSYVGCEGQPLLVSHYKLGQLMYTPQRLTVHEPQPNDRPWAGLLYFTHEADFQNADGTVATTLSREIGVTGRYSYAEQTQKWIHRTFSGATPRGWDNQIGGELGLMAIVEQRRAIAGLSYVPDSGGVQLRSTGHWRVAVGNIMTFVGTGLTFAVGKDLQPVTRRGPAVDVKDAPVLLSSNTKSSEPTSSLSKSCLFEWLECSASASLEVRLMAHNVFLDGTLFKDGPSVERRLLVADADVAVRLDFPKTRSSFSGPWFIQFRVTRRTPEFKSEASVHSQTFGALTVGTEF